MYRLGSFLFYCLVVWVCNGIYLDYGGGKGFFLIFYNYFV